MKSLLQNLVMLLLVAILAASCGKLGKSKSKGLPNDGQLHGVAPGNKYALPKPPGMVYVPQGTFHMGPSDEDISYAFTARNRQISINGFWMDATEITNNEYRQFVYWVRDSIAATILNYKKPGGDGTEIIDQTKAKTIKWSDPKILEQLNAMIVTPDNRILGKKELDAEKLMYRSETFDYKEASRRENAGKPRSQFMVKKDLKIYPDTLVWIRDFSYSYNEPMSKRYLSHPAFGNYR